MDVKYFLFGNCMGTVFCTQSYLNIIAKIIVIMTYLRRYAAGRPSFMCDFEMPLNIQNIFCFSLKTMYIVIKENK